MDFSKRRPHTYQCNIQGYNASDIVSVAQTRGLLLPSILIQHRAEQALPLTEGTWDRRARLVAVANARWYDEASLSTCLHAKQTFFEAIDHLVLAHGQTVRLIIQHRVEIDPPLLADQAPLCVKGDAAVSAHSLSRSDADISPT
jgi:hypothetical protein